MQGASFSMSVQVVSGGEGSNGVAYHISSRLDGEGCGSALLVCGVRFRL